MSLNFSLIFLVCLFTGLWALQCVDHDKNSVDWFIVYKLPKDKNANLLISKGVAYTYLTSLDHSDWKFSNISVNDLKSIIGLNLEPYFTKPSTMHIFYNNEIPDGFVSSKKGHTKGVVLGDNDGGIWLIHSVPHFPPINGSTYYYPQSGLEYGQSFLCISLNLDNLNKVGTQLQYNSPHIFSQNIPKELKSVVPKLEEVVRHVTIHAAPWNHLQLLSSKEGVKFLSFAKGPKFNKELYADWVSPILNVSLYVETWPNGPGRIPSQCGQRFNVNNVKKVSILKQLTFNSLTDHSKWAVVSKDNVISKWVCIGDINRAVGQLERGGGTVCFGNDKVTAIFQNSVTEIEPCSANN